MKKGNLALSQIPFEYCDGAEGGTRTPTGLPTILSIGIFARGLQSVRLSVKFPCRSNQRTMSVWPNTSSFRRKHETSLLQAASR